MLTKMLSNLFENVYSIVKILSGISHLCQFTMICIENRYLEMFLTRTLFVNQFSTIL